MRIAIQGYAGAFHDMAARHYFHGKEIEILACNTFEEVVSSIEEGISDAALMAIENTTFGSLMSNYKLLYRSNVKITGEISLRIRQHLMCLNGYKIEELTEVYSHPIAIAQCEQFFQQYPNIKLIEAVDTALSAKKLRDLQLKKTGAIASSLAAEIYDLNILAESIETNKKNYTRFLVLNKNSESKEEEKVSLAFKTKHEIGCLYKVLQALAEKGANLTKIQSVPILETSYEYMFFIDFIMDPTFSTQDYIQWIEPYTLEIKVLGTYKKGAHYDH